MRKLIAISILFVLIFGIALNAQNKTIAVVPFTGGTGNDGNTIARLLGDELVKASGSRYNIAPRTTAMNKVLEEHKFQRNGLTDADTIAELGKGANAQYVVTGHIQQLGGENLIIVSMTEVATFQQTAGVYYTYNNIAEIRHYLPAISQRLILITDEIDINKTKKKPIVAPTLAILPFDIAAGNATANTDAEVLAQILSCEIANTGLYSVIIRTSTIDQLMEEHKIQRSDITSSENIEKIGEAVNAEYVLTGYVTDLSDVRLMGAQVLDVKKFIQRTGTSVEYKEMIDGLSIMKMLSHRITGSQGNKAISLKILNNLLDARKGQEAIADIKKLISKGNFENKDKYGRTALYLASQYGYISIVKELIVSGADINAKSNDGSTALYSASYNGHTEIVKALIAAGADVNAKDNYRQMALYSASYNGHTEIVKALIAAGADVNAKDNSGETALTRASNKGHTETVKALIAAGADVNAKTNSGYTALYSASENKHTETVKALISAGADVNAKTNSGYTALYSASRYGNTEIVKALIAAGADVNAKDNSGETALYRASRNGHTEIVNLLRAAGAK